MSELRIPKGYKKTEVGVIPDEWGCVDLKQCCNKITDGTHDTPKPVQIGIPYITALHVKEKGVDFNACLYLPSEVHNEIYSRCNPKKNDVLFVNIGAGVATSTIVNVDFEFSLKNVALLKPDQYTIGAYLNYSLIALKKTIISEQSNGGAQSFLSLNQISNIHIPLPPLPEQRAIAEALSDVDNLLSSLDKLIEKKRAIKQGAMQELLTGRKRLPGFSGKWEKKKLGEIASFIASGTSSTKDEQSDYPLYGSTGQIGSRVMYDYQGPVLLIARVGANAGMIYQVDGQYCVSDNTIILRLNDLACLTYIYFCLTYIDLTNMVFGSGQPLITGTQVKEIRLVIPPLPEQTAIAAILSDMDADIEALEKRRDKTKAIKQGMMQELLTGRIRLV